MFDAFGRYGSDHAWDDLSFPIVVRGSVAGEPDMTTLTGNLKAPIFAVNDAVQLEPRVLPHSFMTGSSLIWHVQFITNGLEATAAYVKFSVEWTIANPDGTLAAATTTTSSDIAIPADTADLTHILGTIGTVTPAGAQAGSIVTAILKRVTATGDAPSASPWVMSLNAHVKVNTLGTETAAHTKA